MTVGRNPACSHRSSVRWRSVRGRTQADEGVRGDVGQADARLAGQAGAPRQGQAQRLDRDQPRVQGRRRVRSACVLEGRRVPSSRSARPPSSGPNAVRHDLGELELDVGARGAEAAGQAGQPGASDCWKASATVPVSGSTSWLTAADAVVEVMQQRVQVRLEHRPACVIRSVRPERRSSGVPICSSSRASAARRPTG